MKWGSDMEQYPVEFCTYLLCFSLKTDEQCTAGVQLHFHSRDDELEPAYYFDQSSTAADVAREQSTVLSRNMCL